ncbi:hypothetical protein, partial [Gilliamella apicola]|uniref:hypothetical protein n=1 Tax=Gilliamella apicola TaxID=1196095 RepID=UPI001C0F27DD
KLYRFISFIFLSLYPLSRPPYLYIWHISYGCLTIIDYNKYLKLHNYLIKHRGKGKNEHNIVAVLQVIK